MSQVSITKKEYQTLKRHSVAYQKLTTRLFKAVVQDDITEVVRDFDDTNQYSKGFLKDLEAGLRKSSYSRA